MKTSLNRPLAILWAALLALYCAGVPAAPLAEYEVKAAFVHNFAKYVEWPAAIKARSSLRLCILGQGQFAEAAEGLRGKRVGGAAWEVVPVGSRSDLGECQVLFIEASEADKLPRLLDGLKGSPVLTVADSEGYAAQGVAINFYLEQNKVRFEINPAAAGRAGLKISSQLLKVARIVAEPGGRQ
ncbi:MAG: YfiR family protein [Gallionellaceae bacterium]|nr:YfiR family protein [Gallionellaceae bacterium]